MSDTPKKAAKVAPKTEDTAGAEEPRQEASTMLTTKEAADKLGTDPKTLRKFLRSDISGIEAVGQGRRYAITTKSIPSLTKKFEKWSTKQAEAKAAKAKAAPKKAKASEEPVAEVEELEELEVIDKKPEVERGPGGCIDHTAAGDICKANAMIADMDEEGNPIYGDRCATHQKQHDKVQ